jgi:putative membrane protein
MSKHLLLAASVLALAACGQQSAKTDQPETTTAEGPAMPQAAAMTDAQFVQAVANADAFEIQSSELASSRAARQQVKDLAAMMVRDHSSTTQQLTTLAPTINLTAPTPALNGEMQRKLDGLRSQSGEEFDDAYLDAQVEAHQNAIRTFESFVAGAQAGPLRDWANTTLPKLREHLQHAQGLENAT